MSAEKANAYFVDGIQDEILTRLAKIADLKVISRTSNQHYESAPDNLPEIARQLGVAQILEGSVQKHGHRVRVNVQLIKAANDSRVWAESFDRYLTDIFGVETEVARPSPTSAGASYWPGRGSHRGQTNRRSGSLRRLPARPGFTLKTQNSPGNYLGAQRHFREAVRLDPKFALARALLSDVDARGYRALNLQPTDALREEARQAADDAITLQLTLGEALVANAFVFTVA